MDEGIGERVRKIEGIEKVTNQTYLATITGACCDVPESVVVAFNQDTDFVIRPWLSKTLNRRLQKGEAIVGAESAFNINIGLTEVDTVLFGNMFKMVGILEKTGTGLDTAIFIDQVNIGDILKNSKADLKPGQTSVIFAKVKKGADPYQVAGRIEDAIVEVDVMARKDIGKNLITALKDINHIFLVTVLLVSLLSAFLAWSVFSAIANERSREIGIMRAIGARETHIVKLFLLEVFVIGGIGSVAGILSGTAVSVLLGKSFVMLKSLSTDLSIPERAGIALVSFAFGAGICVLGALAPVQRI
jgi:putative ABC transport system permease protein